VLQRHRLGVRVRGLLVLDDGVAKRERRRLVLVLDDGVAERERRGLVVGVVLDERARIELGGRILLVALRRGQLLLGLRDELADVRVALVDERELRHPGRGRDVEEGRGRRLLLLFLLFLLFFLLLLGLGLGLRDPALGGLLRRGGRL